MSSKSQMKLIIWLVLILQMNLKCLLNVGGYHVFVFRINFPNLHGLSHYNNGFFGGGTKKFDIDFSDMFFFSILLCFTCYVQS